MEDGFTVEREATGVIRHEALSLGLPNRLTEVRLGVQTEIALSALRRVERNNVVARLYRLNTLTHFDNNTRSLVTQNSREGALWIIT